MTDILSLSAQLGKFGNDQKALPPIHEWNPDLSGDLDMEIKEDGRWFHEGDPILREKLSKLFSSILKKEGEEYFLVTPVEKWRIRVEDQPFQAVLADFNKENIQLITNLGDEITLDDPAKLIVDNQEAPKVLVRDNLYARLSRNVFYELAERAVDKEGSFYIEHNGQSFRIG